MSLITEPKNYTGKQLEEVFFRPLFSGAGAEDLGIRVVYNVPVPTTLNIWKGASNVLRKFSTGWEGGPASEKFQKTFDLHKVKSEMGYSAAEYFNMVYENLACSAGVNMEDMSGTLLEEAETKLFRDSLVESIRATMWMGSVARTNGFHDTFDGFLTQLIKDNGTATQVESTTFSQGEWDATDAGEKILKKVWESASYELRDAKVQGNLVYFVTSDVYAKYEDSLDSATLEAAYIAKQTGRPSLSYRGIPVVDMQVSGYLADVNDLPQTWVVLVDKRNLTLAVNTRDFPGSEVRMWYNPDAMENRQRAVFAAGCDYLLPELICYGYKE